MKNSFALPCSQSSSSARMHVKQLQSYVPNTKCGANQPASTTTLSNLRSDVYIIITILLLRLTLMHSSPSYDLDIWFTGCSRCQLTSLVFQCCVTLSQVSLSFNAADQIRKNLKFHTKMVFARNFESRMRFYLTCAQLSIYQLWFTSRVSSS